MDGGVSIVGRQSAVDFGSSDSISNLTALTWEMWINPDGGNLSYLGRQASATATEMQTPSGSWTECSPIGIWNNRVVNWKGNTLIDLDSWYSPGRHVR